MSNRLTSLAVASVALVLGATTVHAAFTTEKCLAQKRKEQGKLQQCRANEDAKALAGKVANFGKCAMKFHDKLAKLDAKAAKCGIACRYVDNGQSITDYDTGLEWVKNTTANGFENHNDPQDADNLYTWSTSVTAADGTVFTDYLSHLKQSPPKAIKSNI